MDFENYASETLDKLIEYYSDAFKIGYNIEIADTVVPVMASMRNRQQRSIFGMTLVPTSLGTRDKRKPSVLGLGPEACEYVFFLREDNFDAGVMAKLNEIFLAAEKEYVNYCSDHAFTFLSVVVIAADIEKDCVKTLKRYKYRKDNRGDGWLLSRIAVFRQGGEAYCNKDGVDLMRMLQKVITL